MSEMSKQSQRIDAAIRENENFDIMQRIKRDADLRDQIIRWVLEHDKQLPYKKCIGCDSVGMVKEYHGKRCKQCTLKYRRANYAENHPTPLRVRKASVSFKKGTKKK